MKGLNLSRNLAEPDEFYAELLAVHEGLSEAQSHALNARLILILANQIGDMEVLRAALAAAAMPDAEAAGTDPLDRRRGTGHERRYGNKSGAKE